MASVNWGCNQITLYKKAIFFLGLLLLIILPSYALKAGDENLHKGSSFAGYLLQGEGKSPVHFRAWLNINQEGYVEGFYRYRVSQCSLLLSGRLDFSTGKMILTEKDCKGKESGTLELQSVKKQTETSQQLELKGTWYSLDRAKSYVISMQRDNWIWLNQWHWLIPAQAEYQPHNSCRVSYQWPTFAGMGLQAQKNLATLFAPQFPIFTNETRNFCQSVDLMTGDIALVMEIKNRFSVMTTFGHWVSIEQYGYTYGGGAHGNTEKNCVLVDLVSGKKVDTKNLIVPAKKADFRKAIKEGLIKYLRDDIQGKEKQEKKTLEDLGVNPQYLDEALQKERMLCFDHNKVYVEFAQYEIGPYAIGFPRAEWSQSEVNPFLLKTPFVDAWLKSTASPR